MPIIADLHTLKAPFRRTEPLAAEMTTVAMVTVLINSTHSIPSIYQVKSATLNTLKDHSGVFAL